VRHDSVRHESLRPEAVRAKDDPTPRGARRDAGSGGRRRVFALFPAVALPVAMTLLAAVALLAVALLVALAQPDAALADPSISDLKKDKAQAKADAEALVAQVASLNDELRAAEGRYTHVKQQLERAKDRVAANKKELQETTALLALSRQQLAERIVAVYKRPDPTLLGLFLQSNSFEGIVANLEFMKRIGAEDTRLVDEVEAAREDLKTRRTRLVSARTAASDLVAQVEEQRAGIEATLAARQTALGEANAEVKRLARKIQKEEAEARRREAEAQALLNSSVSAAVVSGGRYTQQTWAKELLQRAGLPVTASNIAAIVAWEVAEGGHWYNTAYYNPLNTTMPAAGATPMNSVGVKAYTSWEQGFAATIATLRNGFYDGVLAALRAGNNPRAVAAAVAASPWGTGYFNVG